MLFYYFMIKYHISNLNIVLFILLQVPLVSTFHLLITHVEFPAAAIPCDKSSFTPTNTNFCPKQTYFHLLSERDNNKLLCLSLTAAGSHFTTTGPY